MNKNDVKEIVEMLIQRAHLSLDEVVEKAINREGYGVETTLGIIYPEELDEYDIETEGAIPEGHVELYYSDEDEIINESLYLEVLSEILIQRRRWDLADKLK